MNDYISTQETAEILHISPKTLLKWRKKGYALPYYKNKETNRVFYREKEVREYFEKQLYRVETAQSRVDQIEVYENSIDQAIERAF
ncbi:MAG: helix-turn-helix domain-containing protein [Alphaproteobacteria bacterium]|nr:helix-turn-helix domain-containing protein [Alphaproteobacteria bacterium]